MNQMLRKIEPHLDVHGFISQLPSDAHPGADTIQREGMFAAASYFYYQMGLINLEDFSTIKWRFMSRVSLLIKGPGLIRRHLESNRWYSHWDRGSRDQYHVVIGAALVGDRKKVRSILGGFMLRLGFATNIRGNSDNRRLKVPDLMTLSMLSNLIRSFNLVSPWGYLLSPLLLITDIGLVVESLIWRFQNSKKKDETDILNHLQTVLLSTVTLSSPLSELARSQLAQMPSKLDPYVTPVQECLNDYFQSNNGVAALADIYKPIVDKYIYRK